jgi:hypothetical protein
MLRQRRSISLSGKSLSGAQILRGTQHDNRTLEDDIPRKHIALYLKDGGLC